MGFLDFLDKTAQIPESEKRNLEIEQETENYRQKLLKQLENEYNQMLEEIRASDLSGYYPYTDEIYLKK